MWNLGCDIMIRQRRNETDHGIREPEAHRNQVRLGYWRQLHQPIDASGHLLDDALVSERIQRIARNALCNSFTHPELTTMLSEYCYGRFFHFFVQTKSFYLLISGNNMSDMRLIIKGDF